MKNTNHTIMVTRWQAETIHQSVESYIFTVNFVADKESQWYKNTIDFAEAVKNELAWLENESVMEHPVTLTRKQAYFASTAFDAFIYVVDDSINMDVWDDFFEMNRDLNRKLTEIMDVCKEGEADGESGGE